MNAVRKVIGIAGMVLAILAGIACSVDPGHMMTVAALAPSTPEAGLPAWLNVEPAADCSAGCWRVDSVEFEDWHESGHNHHAYVQTRDENGVWVGGVPFHLAYPDGDDRALSKLPPDWGDIAVWACFSPDEGEVGPYWLYGGDDPARSDVVRGIGLPECQHVNVKVVLRYQEQTPVPPCGGLGCIELWLPMINSAAP